jgi:hypothetical protein
MYLDKQPARTACPGNGSVRIAETEDLARKRAIYTDTGTGEGASRRKLMFSYKGETTQQKNKEGSRMIAVIQKVRRYFSLLVQA